MKKKFDEIAKAIHQQQCRVALGDDCFEVGSRKWEYLSDKDRDDFRSIAYVALRAMIPLPPEVEDPYWPLRGNIGGATSQHPIPSMLAAITAYIDWMMK